MLAHLSAVKKCYFCNTVRNNFNLTRIRFHNQIIGWVGKKYDLVLQVFYHCHLNLLQFTWAVQIEGEILWTLTHVSNFTHVISQIGFDSPLLLLVLQLIEWRIRSIDYNGTTHKLCVWLQDLYIQSCYPCSGEKFSLMINSSGFKDVIEWGIFCTSKGCTIQFWALMDDVPFPKLLV